ncbi:MAG: GDP-mannose 4,6-dehydratase [Deltaproteobacteria bacterium]|nr:GDP-mannose 4,6-dehydratase [Deltaproteobacteria bacterium]
MFRPTEFETLLSDPAKAKADLDWIPQITLDEMIEEMVTHELDDAKYNAPLKANCCNIMVSKEN